MMKKKLSPITCSITSSITYSIISTIFILMSIGCGSSDTNPEIPEALKGDYELLFIGNSHSSMNGLPNLVAILIEAGEPGKVAYSDLAPGWNFLADRLNDGVTQEALESRNWTHVFLHAQKYSTSGNYTYPTVGAEEWIRRAKSQDSLPIMFPEWPREGNTEEGLRVHELHVAIASREPACVAPVGLVWDKFIELYPYISLHATDGNHSNLKGALLTAYVFYQVVTGNNAIELDYISEIDVPESTQYKLKEVASAFHEYHLPCP
jgi:hypothetical protein